MRFAATCNFGLSSVLKREIERLGFPIEESTDRMIRFSGDFETLVRANISLRTANRVYLECADGPARDFDELFELTKKADWKNVLPLNRPVEIRPVSDKSRLDSLPAIQKTVKKALVVAITGSSAGILAEDPALEPVSVLTLIRDDHALLLLDTSGEPLHKRGYRQRMVEAPIKETLAAGLVLLSGWRFSEPFSDPFCGSGTIGIEAAMIAKNIAPGLRRNFAFQGFPFYNRDVLEKIRKELATREFRDNPHRIFLSDSDPEAIEMARANAEAVGLSGDIAFSVANFPDDFTTNAFPFYGKGTVVTNPPYGERLLTGGETEIHRIHGALFDLFKSNSELSGGVITALDEFTGNSKRLNMKDRKIPNGSIPCRFCFRVAEKKEWPTGQR